MTTESTPATEAVQELELFCCAVAADPDMSDADKITWLHKVTHEYWARLEERGPLDA